MSARYFRRFMMRVAIWFVAGAAIAARSQDAVRLVSEEPPPEPPKQLPLRRTIRACPTSLGERSAANSSGPMSSCSMTGAFSATSGPVIIVCWTTRMRPSLGQLCSVPRESGVLQARTATASYATAGGARAARLGPNSSVDGRPVPVSADSWPGLGAEHGVCEYARGPERTCGLARQGYRAFGGCSRDLPRGTQPGQPGCPALLAGATGSDGSRGPDERIQRIVMLAPPNNGASWRNDFARTRSSGRSGESVARSWPSIGTP